MNFFQSTAVLIGFCIAFFLGALFYFPAGVSAQQGAVTPIQGAVTPRQGAETPRQGAVTPPAGTAVTLINPLGETTITGFFLKIIDILIIFAIPVIVFFIMLAGFKYVTARGNSSEIETATTALTWAVVGGVIILGARLILQVIEGTVSSLRM